MNGNKNSLTKQNTYTKIYNKYKKIKYREFCYNTNTKQIWISSQIVYIAITIMMILKERNEIY